MALKASFVSSSASVSSLVGLMAEERISLSEASRRAGVSAGTLKRWAEEKVVPVRRVGWTAAAAAQARVVARMRERGHSLADLKKAGREGRLAFGLAEDLLPQAEEEATAEEGGGGGRLRLRPRRGPSARGGAAGDRGGGGAGDRPRAGADRAHPGHPRHPGRPRAKARAR